MSEPDYPAHAERLRRLQVETLARKPDHEPLVMCTRCGHTIAIPVRDARATCARGHTVVNPHFRGDRPAPPPSRAAAAPPSTGETDDAPLLEWRRPRTVDATSTTRLVVVTVVYLLVVLGGVAALVLLNAS